MSGELQGRVAIITGAGAGIGRATALAMAREGARVVVYDLVAEGAETVAHEIIASGGEAMPFAGSVADFEATGTMVQAVIETFGRIDILHNNAGVSAHHPIWEFTEKHWDLILSVNLKGVFNCIRHVSPHMMRQKWGRIINVSSIARRGTPGNAAYSAAKAGIIGLTGTTARDMAPYGVTCNAYLPTAATQLMVNEENRVRITKGFQEGAYTREQYEELLNPPPPETVPPLIVYLCTEQAGNISGQVFDIAGNYIAIYAESFKRSTIYKGDGIWTLEELKEVVPKALKTGS